MFRMSISVRKHQRLAKVARIAAGQRLKSSIISSSSDLSFHEHEESQVSSKQNDKSAQAMLAFTDSAVADSMAKSTYSSTTAVNSKRINYNDPTFKSESIGKNIEDDGYGLNQKDQHLWWVRQFQKPPDPGTLMLVRHGESEWNQRQLFTGWVDVDLSERGVLEIEHAARLMLERGYTVDITYTSMLKRAIRSSWIILNEINQIYRPIIKSWRLNERMYGALEGHSKPGLARVFGKDIVQQWRAGLLDRPPSMSPEHIYWHGRERKYNHLNPAFIPRTESLQNTIDRVVPLWDSHILPDLKAGRNVLIVAHCNSLRGIVKHIDGIGTDDIQKMGIPNGIPLVYKFERGTMKPVTHKNAQPPLRGIWLEKKGLLRAALEKEEELATQINGYDTVLRPQKGYYSTRKGVKVATVLSTVPAAPLINHPHHPGIPATAIPIGEPHGNVSTAAGFVPPYSAAASTAAVSASGNGVPPSLIKSLTKLEHERKLLELVDDKSKDSIDYNKHVAFDESSYADLFIDRSILNSAAFSSIPTNLANMHGIEEGVDHIERAVTNIDKNFEKLNKIHFFKDDNSEGQNILIHANITDKAKVKAANSSAMHPVYRKPLLVIIRHGKTEHNQLGLFTGWEDALLAEEGRDEAIHAGKLLRSHGIEFDVVYTSWLSRAIETAWLVLNELDSLWLPVVKTWRLNERMYGALTGLSKKMIRQIYGDEQFMKWRRGFDTKPPTISSFSHAYPGNDNRYVKYVTDVDISIFETLIRSLAHGKLEIHRSFPKAESLRDCMERTIPYFLKTIVPDSMTPGKNVLIASSENAIRGLLMHLCQIPQDKIPNVEIPTGLPLIYDSELRKLRLLEDKDIGSTVNPLEKYNFGSAPELLFGIEKDKTHDKEYWQSIVIPRAASFRGVQESKMQQSSAQQQHQPLSQDPAVNATSKKEAAAAV